MTYSAQTFDASGNLLFDTQTAPGFVTADYRIYAAGDAGETVSYPQWAGYTAYLLDCGGKSYLSTTLSTSGGYPVITVTSTTYAKSFALIVY